MKASLHGSFYRVRVSAHEVGTFKTRWPNFGPVHGIIFEFDARNGDLINIGPHTSSAEKAIASMDGSGVSALSDDAMIFGAKKLKLMKVLELRKNPRRANGKSPRKRRGNSIRKRKFSRKPRKSEIRRVKRRYSSRLRVTRVRRNPRKHHGFIIVAETDNGRRYVYDGVSFFSATSKAAKFPTRDAAKKIAKTLLPRMGRNVKGLRIQHGKPGPV